MKRILSLLALMALVGSASAAVYQVNNVHSLTNMLALHQKVNDIIQLAPGDYNLKGIQMKPDSDKGGSHLFVKYASIVGSGKTPWETRLIGDGTLRILDADNSAYYQNSNLAVRVENVTLTNGYARITSGIQYSGDGGGVYGHPCMINSVVIGCKADYAGGGSYSYLYCWRSKFINNWAKSYAGGAFHPNFVYDCEFIGNTCDEYGGAIYMTGDYGSASNTIFRNNYAGSAGGAIVGVRTVHDCRFENNESSEGGAIYARYNYSNMTYNCYFYGNRANNYGGASVNSLILSNCYFACNTARVGGGATFSWGDKYAEGNKVIDSILCSNACDVVASPDSYGGATRHNYVVNCKVFDNYAKHAGADDSSVYINCDVHHNRATGNTGGLYTTRAYKCRIWDNIGGTIPANGMNRTGQNGYYCKLYDCDVSGTGMNGVTAVNTIFHDIGREVKIKNQYATVAASNMPVAIEGPICTNCVFVNNQCSTFWNYNGSSHPGIYGQCLFEGNATRGVHLVNCTVASNSVGQIIKYLSTTDVSMFENTVMFNNMTYWGNCDMTNFDGSYDPIDGRLLFKNSAYGIASGGSLSTGGSIKDSFIAPGSKLYRFGFDGVPATPGFVREVDAKDQYPFEPRYNSFLRGLAPVEPWMETAYDVRGDIRDGAYSRLRDGKCDIGAYQCWRWPEHTTFSIR